MNQLLWDQVWLDRGCLLPPTNLFDLSFNATSVRREARKQISLPPYAMMRAVAGSKCSSVIWHLRYWSKALHVLTSYFNSCTCFLSCIFIQGGRIAFSLFDEDMLFNVSSGSRILTVAFDFSSLVWLALIAPDSFLRCLDLHTLVHVLAHNNQFCFRICNWRCKPCILRRLPHLLHCLLWRFKLWFVCEVRLLLPPLPPHWACFRASRDVGTAVDDVEAEATDCALLIAAAKVRSCCCWVSAFQTVNAIFSIRLNASVS